MLTLLARVAQWLPRSLHKKNSFQLHQWDSHETYDANTNLRVIFRCFFANFAQNCVFMFILPMVCLGGKRHYFSIIQDSRNLLILAGKSIGGKQARHLIPPIKTLAAEFVVWGWGG